MTLQTATANLEQIKTDLHDNADYWATNDLAKAKVFLTALTRAIVLYPQLVSKNREQELRYDLVTLQREQEKAQEFVSRNRNTKKSRFRQVQFERFSSRFGS